MALCEILYKCLRNILTYLLTQFSVCICVYMAVGLDATRPLIHEHCKKLLVNVLLAFATHSDHFTVAKLAISNRTVNETSCLNLATSSNYSTRQTGVTRTLATCSTL